MVVHVVVHETECAEADRHQHHRNHHEGSQTPRSLIVLINVLHSLLQYEPVFLPRVRIQPQQSGAVLAMTKRLCEIQLALPNQEARRLRRFHVPQEPTVFHEDSWSNGANSLGSTL